jgi:hypothetical protein
LSFHPVLQPKQKNETTQTTNSFKTSSKDSIVESKTIPEEIKNEKLNFGNSNIPEEQIVIETQLARFELSNKGANFRKIFLSKFKNWYSANKKGEPNFNDYVQLINYTKGGSYDISFVSVLSYWVTFYFTSVVSLYACW